MQVFGRDGRAASSSSDAAGARIQPLRRVDATACTGCLSHKRGALSLILLVLPRRSHQTHRSRASPEPHRRSNG
eukprot:scaffold130518_cov26-Tisochrysis_lutea.AAC.2